MSSAMRRVRPRGTSVTSKSSAGRTIGGRSRGVGGGSQSGDGRSRIDSGPGPDAFEEWIKAYTSGGFGSDSVVGGRQTYDLRGAIGQPIVRTAEEREKETQRRAEVRKTIEERRRAAEERRREERKKIEEKRKSDDTLRKNVLRMAKDGVKVNNGVPVTPFADFQWPNSGSYTTSAAPSVQGSKPLPQVPKKEKVRSVLNRLHPERLRESSGRSEEAGTRAGEERLGAFVRYLSSILHRVVV